MNISKLIGIFFFFQAYFQIVQGQEGISTFDGSFIHIPSVKAGENIYKNVSLMLKDGSQFTFNSADNAVKSESPAAAQFDGAKLLIRNLKYQEHSYSNIEFRHDGDLDFSVVAANTPLLTSSSSFENRNTELWIDYVTIRNPVISQKIAHDYETCLCEYYGVAYADFDLDGDDDLLISSVWWGTSGLADYDLDNYRSIPVEMYLNDGLGNFEYTEDLFIGSPPLASNTRKAIVADFNGDIYPDVFLAETGFDGSPFPGTTPTIIISDIEGKYRAREIDNQLHFMHGAAAGDLDADGDSDIVARGCCGIILYRNDGTGKFTKSRIDYFKSSIGIFNLEVFDFNSDSYLDIITTGHVWTTKTQIVFGPEFNEGIEIENSELTKNHVVNDIQFSDLDNDGINEIIQSTTGGEGSFYQGAYIEIVYFDEYMRQEANQIIYQDTGRWGPIDRSYPKWIWWLKIADINEDGKLDVMEDDKHDRTVLLNTGNRNFVLRKD